MRTPDVRTEAGAPPISRAEAVRRAAKRIEDAGAHVEPMQPFMTPKMLQGMDHFWRMRSLSDLRTMSAEQRARRADQKRPRTREDEAADTADERRLDVRTEVRLLHRERSRARERRQADGSSVPRTARKEDPHFAWGWDGRHLRETCRFWNHEKAPCADFSAPCASNSRGTFPPGANSTRLHACSRCLSTAHRRTTCITDWQDIRDVHPCNSQGPPSVPGGKALPSDRDRLQMVHM